MRVRAKKKRHPIISNSAGKEQRSIKNLQAPGGRVLTRLVERREMKSQASCLGDIISKSQGDKEKDAVMPKSLEADEKKEDDEP